MILMNDDYPHFNYYLGAILILYYDPMGDDGGGRVGCDKSHYDCVCGLLQIFPIVVKKVWFYIALYPVHWTAQSALHFPPLADLFIPTPFSASLGSILAMQQLRNDYSLTFPPLSIARYSFIQLSRLRRREVKENAQTSKRYQRGFEPGLSRLRVRHSTPEPPRVAIDTLCVRPIQTRKLSWVILNAGCMQLCSVFSV